MATGAETPAATRPAARPGGSAVPRTPRRPLQVTVAAALLVLATPLASAQAITLLAGGSAGGPIARLGLADVRHAGGTAGLAAVLSPAPGLDVDVRTARAVGGVGTLTFDVSGGVRASSTFQARLRLAARGTIGPVAGRIEASGWNAAPERFDPLTDPGTARGAAGVALLMDADYRLDGRWLLGGTVRAEWATTGMTVDAALDARARRLLGPELDLTGHLGTRWADGGDGRAALAAGVVFAPRRLPEIGLTAFLELAPTDTGSAAAPGLETYGARTLGGGRLGWSVRLRPLAPERAPWLVEVDWRRTAGEGTLTLRSLLAHGGEGGTRWAASAGYELPFDPR